MVKLFFTGVVIVTLALTGIFAAIFGPLVVGADRNLHHPQSPLDSPVPRFIGEIVHSLTGQTTPALILTALLGLMGLLIVYLIGTLLARVVQNWRHKRRLWAELRWRGRVAALREQNATPASDEQPRAEFESLWE